MADSGLRLLIYDGAGRSPLHKTWALGARVYRALGRVDAHHGAANWADALAWLSQYRAGRPVAEVQYWGHGKWGALFIEQDVLNVHAFDAGHRHRPALEELRARLLPGAGSLIWLRTCETFGARAGQVFAARSSRFFGARVAGHTHVIGVLQSGLHGLRPGEEPKWPDSEGLARGTPDAPILAKNSAPDAPNTIHFMNNAVPESWFDG